MDRNPKSKTFGQEKLDWNTKKYPKPTDEELLSWYDDCKYLESRVYAQIGEQLDRLWHDIDAGLFGDKAKTGEFYIKNKSIKDNSPKK
jgi:hypothetical protein